MVKTRELVGMTEEYEGIGKVREIPAAAYVLRFEDNSELVIGSTGGLMFVRAITGPKLAEDGETITDCDSMAADIEVEYRRLMRKGAEGDPFTADEKELMRLIGNIAFEDLAMGKYMAESVKAIADEIKKELEKGNRDAEFEEQIKNGILDPTDPPATK